MRDSTVQFDDVSFRDADVRCLSRIHKLETNTHLNSLNLLVSSFLFSISLKIHVMLFQTGKQ
jgi:hypothetical protein